MPELRFSDWKSPVKLLNAVRSDRYFMRYLKEQSPTHYLLVLNAKPSDLVPLLLLLLHNEYCRIENMGDFDNARNVASLQLNMVMIAPWNQLKVQEDILKLLIGAAGALLPGDNASSEPPQSALLTACRYGHIAVVQAMFKIDPTLMRDSALYRKAMSIASRRNLSMIVEILITTRAMFDPLHYPLANDFEGPAAEASKLGNIDVIKVLVKRGLDIDTGSGLDRWRMIHHASKRGDTKLVNYLLSKGANPTIAPWWNWRCTPLNLAKKSKSSDANLVKILERAVIDWEKTHPEKRKG